MRKDQPSDSPFYDREFATQPTPHKGTDDRSAPTPRPPRRYTETVICVPCCAPARMITQPTRTLYRCSACNALLATVSADARMTVS